MVSNIIDFEGLLSSLNETITEAIVFLGRQTVEFLFAVDPLRTDGVWPFGRPVAPSTVGPDVGFGGGAVGYFASQAYDWSSFEVAGEMVLFALLIFVVLFSIGGYVQFFDWELPPPEQRRDPLYGLVFMIFWFPAYFALLSISHEIFFILAPPPSDTLAILGSIIPSAVFLPGGRIMIGVAVLGVIVYAVLMYVRAVLIGAYLVFGPIFIAIVWADLYNLSDQVLSVLKYSVGVALAPLGMPIVLWFLMLLLGGDVPGLDMFGLNGIVTTIAIGAQTFAGVLVFAVCIWVGIYLSWKIFRKSGGLVDKAGGVAARFGSAAGLYQYSGREDAVKAMKYGPTSVVGRKAVRGVDQESGGESRGDESSGDDREGGRVSEWVSKYWGRDGKR